MAAIKSLISLSSRATLLFLLIALATQTQMVRSQMQTCSAQLGNLNVCAPFVVPGVNTNPTPDCCAALRSVDHDCLCSTLRIASRLPTQCNLRPLACDTNA